jgi:SEC-C motif
VPGSGRNQPCPCGSGRETKHCCGQTRGPSNDQLDRAFIAQHTRWAAAEIGDLSTPVLHDLWRSIIELPDLDLSLVVPLPTLISPELEQLLQAALNDDPDTAEELIPTVLETIDTPHQRAQLARAILNLRDAGKLSTRHAAAAIIDLAGETHTLLRASLLNAIFIKTGNMQTPGGLRIAA